MKISNVLCSRTAVVNRFTQRSHNCGQLRIQNEGNRVLLKGWVSYKRYNKFFVLKDSYGTVQILTPEKMSGFMKDVPHESVVAVEGVVINRGENSNKSMATGDIEVLAEDIQVLNLAPVNLPIHSKVDAQEQTKLANRFLDLRSERMQKNLRLRSQLIHEFRKILVENCGFVDVETPILSQWTPGGAHEFIVPSGKIRGHFYSLPQSPQIFKQLLMVGGVDRYFQIAKCFRDEGSMQDRQPEFTQLDLEMSFAGQEDVIGLVEELIRSSWPDVLTDYVPQTPFKRMTYEQVMREYGTDKPDLRVPWKIFDCTQAMSSSPLKTFEDWKCQAFIAKGAVNYEDKFRKREWKRLIQMKHDNAKWRAVNLHKENPFKNFDAESFIQINGVRENDIVVFSWGKLETCQETLGTLRNFVGEVGGMRSKGFEWLWVVDFPLFCIEDDQLQSSHHPFTAPISEDLDKLKDKHDLTKIRAQHYDLVLNGSELGGGSVRVHNCLLQRHIIEILQLPIEPLEGFLQALSMGAPPHAGFALGIDRYIALLAAEGDSTASIRDVIAFPKTKEGRCLTTGAPSIPPEYVLDRYSIKVSEDAKEEKGY
ncbi:unnamed protein product [Bursaphelenchus xylophilus]|uniref:(pine wood nematode) hypothetical protein n=1 Tax=Bursaphelenchus xylophilus TaxID=6326 RepID=A0A1I7RS50_BURXY|nr:unnamed protein product [Bursaphelenchus xylophilus]CAG9123214.1 unnamed protein product [Bursaphelenchus xylophilus]